MGYVHDFQYVGISFNKKNEVDASLVSLYI